MINFAVGKLLMQQTKPIIYLKQTVASCVLTLV